MCQLCYNHNSNPARLEISYIQEYYKHAILILFRTFTAPMAIILADSDVLCYLLLIILLVIMMKLRVPITPHMFLYHQGTQEDTFSLCCSLHFSTILLLVKYGRLLAYSFQTGNPILEQLIKWPKLSLFFLMCQHSQLKSHDKIIIFEVNCRILQSFGRRFLRDLHH